MKYERDIRIRVTDIMLYWNVIGKPLVGETIMSLSETTQFCVSELNEIAYLIYREDESQSSEDIRSTLYKHVGFCAVRNIELSKDVRFIRVIVAHQGIEHNISAKSLYDKMFYKYNIIIGKNKEDYLENENVRQYFSSHPEQIKRVQKENRLMRKYGRERRGSR